jgi:hypothetical protein
LAVANGNVAILDLNRQEAQAPPKTLDVVCSLNGNFAEECIRRLCEKVSLLITDKVLMESLQPSAYGRLKQTGWNQTCTPR